MYFLLIKKSCCIFLNDRIHSCIDGNNPNITSINFNKNINRYNHINNYINNHTKITINKNPTYSNDDLSNNEGLYFNYKKKDSNIQENNNEKDDKNMDLETPFSNNKITKEDINELNKNKINNNISEIGINDIKNINHINNKNIFDYSNERNDNSNIKINEDENLQLKLLEESPALREEEKMIKNSSYEDNSNYFKEEVETSNIINQENKDKNNFLNEGNKNVDSKEKIEKDKQNNNAKDKEMEKKEIFTNDDKKRSKIMDRINRGRARSSDNKNQKDTKSQNILMKAKLLGKVLGNMKQHSQSNYNFTSNNYNKNEIINYNDDSSKYQVENIPLNKNKKKKKNIIPFKE